MHVAEQCVTLFCDFLTTFLSLLVILTAALCSSHSI